MNQTQAVAEKLVSYCRKGQFEDAQKELFADNAVSIEPDATPDFPKETRGKAAILEKGRKFSSLVEKIHGVRVSDPIVAGESFACTLTMDATMKGRGRSDMNELCVYEVKDGKIASEEFHY